MNAEVFSFFMARSLKKGPFVADSLLRKFEAVGLKNSNGVIFTWSRSSSILPIMVGFTLGVHNGREHIPILIV
jgi:small subunit ribosomal protein S19